MEIGWKKLVWLEVIIESVVGFENIVEIVGVSLWFDVFYFGVVDYVVLIGMRMMNIGGFNLDYVILIDFDVKELRDIYW